MSAILVNNGSSVGDIALPDSQILVGNASNIAAPVAMTGDVTISNTGVTTIGASKVTEAMQILADNTTNDVSTTKHGYAPKAPNDPTKYLDGTGNYSVPAGGASAPFSDATALVKADLDPTKTVRIDASALNSGYAVVVSPASDTRSLTAQLLFAYQGSLYSAGAGNTGVEGADNVVIGLGTSGGVLTTGSGNTVLGANAFGAASTGRLCVAIGNNTMSEGTIVGNPNGSIGIGYYTLRYLADGTYNVGIGHSAGAAITSGSENILLGRSVAGALNTGSYNVIIGSSAGNAIQASTDNVVIGREAMKLGSSRSQNVIIGSQACDTGSAGGQLTAIGYRAMRNVAENNNTGVGAQVGASLSTGSDNCFFGRYAGGAITTGVSNVCLGDTSQDNNFSSGVNGSGIIAIGNGAYVDGSNKGVIGSPKNGAHLTDLWIGYGQKKTSLATSALVGLHVSDGSGSNANGANAGIYGGAGTGTGRGGDVSVLTSPSGSSGSSANTAVTRNVVVAQGKALTDATPVSLFEIALPTLTMTGGQIQATVICTDGTDMQSVTQTVTFAAVNKGAAYTTDIDVAVTSTAASAGTLVNTWSVLTGSNKVTIQLSSDTSLTPTKFVVYYQVTNNSEQAVTIL